MIKKYLSCLCFISSLLDITKEYKHLILQFSGFCEGVVF